MVKALLPTPSDKRHHLPFSIMDKRPSLTVSKLNNMFLMTVLMAFTFQVFCSLLSYNHINAANSRLMQTMFLLTADHQKSDAGNIMQDPVDQLHRRMEVVTSPRRPSVKHQFGAEPHSGRLRVLVGILTADFFNDQVYRKRHRMLFKLWDDERVCSLPEFKQKPASERYTCELIYTFVIGANPDAPPELVDGSRPFEVKRPIRGISNDLNEPDMTLLNIRENMNEGKSQTWMAYGAQIAEEYDLDYVTKCDADSIFHLHEFFVFAYKHLPPAPYNSMMYVGALRDKAYWPKHDTEAERIRFESYFGNNFEGVHLYVAGQMYIMSRDLAKYVGEEALLNKCSYCEGHEDHDISAMAFHSKEPIKLLVIGRSHRFWEHPVKGEPRWKRIWAREEARMAGEPFEGRLFFTNSTLAAVFPDQVLPAEQQQ